MRSFISKFKISRRGAIFIPIIVIGLFIVTFKEASAADPIWTALAVFKSIVGSVFASTAIDAMTWAFEQIGKLLVFVTWLMGIVVKLPVYARDMPVIYENWKIMRDIANLVFIVALIVMAYGTIFQLKSWSFNSAWFIKLIFMAVIVNFSLVIGVTVIEIFQILTNTMLNVIGGGDIATKFGEGLNLANIFTVSENGEVIRAGVAATSSVAALSLILSIFLLFTILSITAVVTLIAIVRIPILWGLLIISPIVWVAGAAFPSQTKKIVPFDWWSEFIKWNSFLPIYLFFFYLGLTVLTRQNEVLGAISGGTNLKNSLLGGAPIFAFQTIFTFAFAVLVMGFAVKAGLSFNSGTMKDVLNAPGLKGIFGYASSAKNIARYNPIGARVDAMGKAIAARQKEFGERGFRTRFLNKLYGGKEAQSRIDARMADSSLFKVGNREAVAGQLGKDRGFYEAKYKNMSVQQLRALKTSGLPAGAELARMELLRKQGALSGGEIMNMYDKYQAADPSGKATKAFLGTLDYEKMDTVARDKFRTIASGLRDAETLRKVREAQIKQGDISDATKLAEIAAELYSEDTIADTATMLSRRAGLIKLAEEKSYMAAQEARLIAGVQMKDRSGNVIAWDNEWTTTPSTANTRKRNNAIKLAMEVAASQGKIKDDELVRTIVDKPKTDAARRGVINGISYSKAKKIAEEYKGTAGRKKKIEEMADDVQIEELRASAERLEAKRVAAEAKITSLGGILPGPGATSVYERPSTLPVGVPTATITKIKTADAIRRTSGKKREKITKDYGI